MLLASIVIGCAAKPPETPIVLRHHKTEHRISRRLPPKPPVAAAPVLPVEAQQVTPPEPPPMSDAVASKATPAAHEPLSETEKDGLFRDFDAYLARKGHAP